MRLVVIGGGLIGREHCGLIRASDKAELVGLADISDTAAHYAAEQNTPFYPDYAVMLDQLRPDGAIIAVPNQLHEEVGLACLSRGIPSIMEKPIAPTIAEAQRMVAASEAAGVPMLVGHHRRYSPDIYSAKKLVEEGRLGELVGISGLWLTDKPDDYFQADWRRQKGGGPLLINLIHDIDCLRYMAGDVEEVMAITSSRMRGFEVEDTASVSLRLKNGALASFILSDAAASPFTWEITTGQALYFPHQPGDCYFLAGRQASLAVPSMTLWRHREPGQHWQHPFVSETIELDGSQCYENQLAHFCDVIAGRAEPVITARDGMLTLASVMAVARSAEEGRLVAVEEIISA